MHSSLWHWQMPETLCRMRMRSKIYQPHLHGRVAKGFAILKSTSAEG